MVTKLKGFTALTILVLSTGIVGRGAKYKDPPSSPAPQDSTRNQIVQQLQNTNYPVRLLLRDHTKVRGRVLKNYSFDHFTIQTLKGSQIVERTIRYDQVKKVSYVFAGHPYLKLVAGNVVGSGILALIILAAVGAL